MPDVESIRAARILVVDDREADARLVTDILRGSGYANVASTTDPGEACELYRRDRHDLVILDLVMPRLDGFAVMESMREREPVGYLPVLAVTADAGLMGRALEAGAKDFIGKPVRMAELVARVGNLIEVRLLTRALLENGRKLERRLEERTADLRENEALFRLFAEHLPEGLWIRGSQDQRFHYLNPALERIVGCKLVAGDGIDRALERLHPDDRRAVLDEIRRHPLGGVALEVRFVHDDGAVRWGSVRTFAMGGPEDASAWIAGIVEDVTERKATEGALRKSESRFRVLVEQSIAGIYILQDWRFVYANPRLCEMLGYSPDELLGKESMDLVVPGERDALASNLRRAAAGDPGALVGTYRLQRKDGTIVHLAVDGRMLTIDGRALLFGVAQDVTEAAQARELLREAEGHYRALVEQSLVGIYIIDKHRIVYANPKVCDITGYSAAELAALDVPDLVVAEDRGLVDETLRRRRAGETGSIAVDCRVRRKDGRVVTLSIESKIVELGGRKAAFGIVQDITEGVRSAAALRESEEKYRLLWENTTDAVVLVDDDMRIRYANPSVRRIFGYAPAEIEGLDVALLQPERLRAAHRAGVARYLDTAARTVSWSAFETTGLRRDGHEFPLEIGFSHLFVAGQSIFAAFMRDVSDRRRAQAALENANKRLRILSKRVLDIQEEERRHISRELHDDIGQTLFALKMGLHRLAGRVGREESGLLGECIGVADAIQEKLRELVLQLHPPQLEQLGLRDALGWLVNRQRSVTGLEIACEFAGLEGERLPAAIENACFRICQEALSNAVRHARASRVEVAARLTSRELSLTIRDDGVGFDEPARRDAAVMGGSLGLISMEERARLAGGRLELRTGPGEGTLVRAMFPLDAPERRAPDPIASARPE